MEQVTVSQTNPHPPLSGKPTLEMRVASPSPPYMGRFKINHQRSISWKEKEMFQSVSLQTDLLPLGSAYFKKCLSLVGAMF